MTPLEHEHFFAGTRKVRGIYETVMSAADHDDVVFLRHAFVRIASAFCVSLWLGNCLAASALGYL